MIKVIKRDSSLEDFDPVKIENVAVAAGLEPTQAEALSTEIERWLAETKPEKISSLQIRDKVVTEMAKLNQIATNAYTWYESTKDTSATA